MCLVVDMHLKLATNYVVGLVFVFSALSSSPLILNVTNRHEIHGWVFFLLNMLLGSCEALKVG